MMAPQPAVLQPHGLVKNMMLSSQGTMQATEPQPEASNASKQPDQEAIFSLLKLLYFSQVILACHIGYASLRNPTGQWTYWVGSFASNIPSV